MRIGFDGHALMPPKAGLWANSWSLLTALRVDPESEHAFCAADLRGEEFTEPEYPRNWVLPPKKLPWQPLQKAGIALGFPKCDDCYGNPDLLHCLWHNVPPTRRESFIPAHGRQYDRWTGYAVRGSDAVMQISENTDRTLEICGRHPKVKAVVKPYRSEAPLRDFGIDMPKGEWVLVLDADEKVTAESRLKLLDLEAGPIRSATDSTSLTVASLEIGG